MRVRPDKSRELYPIRSSSPMQPIVRYIIAGITIVSGVVLIGVGAGFGIVPLIAGGVALVAIGGGVCFLGGTTPAILRS
jgi:hypothetical protein